MTDEQIKIAQETIDRLYQEILARKIKFSAEIKEVFHDHMNRLTEMKNLPR